MTLRKNYLPFITLLAFAIAGSVQAQDSSEADELNQFMNLLEQQTSLATNTRLNADFVPGMLSVLTAEQMQRRGFRTLWEALASIPGVQTTMNETGMRSITVRGIGKLFEPSKVKLLLNGKALNSSAGATTGTLYDTPVEQIERVEFIRGPGSAIYGEFAYAGVVNVITRQQGEQYSAGIESGNGLNFAALYSYEQPGGDFKTSINIAASQADGDDIDSGLDRTPAGTPTYAPGPLNNKRDFVSAILSFETGDLVALLQLQEGNRGDHFGTNNLLPPDDRQTVISESVLSADVRQSFELDEQLSGAWSLNLLNTETEQNSLFFGVAQFFDAFSTEDDVVADSLLEERRLEAEINLNWEVSAHTLFGALIMTDLEVKESEQFISLDPITRLPTAMLNEFPSPVGDSEERSSISVVLQDEYRIDDRLTLTAGLRYDNYEDIDSNLSPRIALVWRRSDQHIFKTQLARAFKPPSLIEEGGSIETDIDSETNDTLEFGHIFLDNDLVLRNTIYFSKLDNLILFQDFAPFGYFNSGSFDLRGYELEVDKSVGNDWDINASLSLQDYVDDKLPGAAPWMLKLGVEYALMPLTGVHLQVNSLGNRDREETDTRGDFEQTTQVDVSLRMQNFSGIDGLNFRAGIVNLLDDELKHPAPLDSYPDDYPYSDGATLWAQFTYEP
ncbi:MAG: TonB-dependent receptor [Gammaproteobacteria bacterium]|nr:TonB-dependent receptor [Gammaproteobacteria bacterium]